MGRAEALTGWSKRHGYRNTRDCPQSIANADVLSRGPRSPGVTYGYLQNPAAGPSQLRRDLRLDPKPLLRQYQPLNQLSSKGLLSRFHVGEPQARESV